MPEDWLQTRDLSIRRVTAFAASLILCLVFLTAAQTCFVARSSADVLAESKQDTMIVGLERDPATGKYLQIKAPIGSGYVPKYQIRAELPCVVADDALDPTCMATYADRCPPKEPGGEAGRFVRYLSAAWGLRDPAFSEMNFTEAGVQCFYNTDVINPVEAIAGLVARELQTRQIAAAKFGVQPSPNTLRGVNTNFFAIPAAQTFELRLLNQQVTMVAYPVTNTFNYGDGSKLGPTSATGVDLIPDKWGEETPTSHVYKATGDYTASVTTTYRGTFSVNGGPAMPITGEANVTSPGVRVSVWKTKVDWYSNPGDKK